MHAAPEFPRPNDHLRSDLDLGCARGQRTAAVRRLRNLVASHFDHDLQDHARELSSLVEVNSDGAPILARDFSDPRYLAARSGHYWQVHLPGGKMIRSPSLDADLELPAGPDGDSPAAASVNGPTGTMRMLRRVVQGHHLKEPVEIRIGADERLISDEMSHLHMVLATSLGLMAFGMIGTAYAQVAFGLRPLAASATRFRRCVRGP